MKALFGERGENRMSLIFYLGAGIYKEIYLFFVDRDFGLGFV